MYHDDSSLFWIDDYSGNLQQEKIFINPDGFCTKLTTSNLTTLWLQSNSSVGFRVYVVDYYTDNEIFVMDSDLTGQPLTLPKEKGTHQEHL